MENDFALLAQVLGLEGEYHVSLSIDDYVNAIARLKQNDK
jgi:hypothetical protein